MNSRTIWTIGVSSDLAVIGYNPEMADMDNPRGEIIREVFHLEATNDYGDRKIFPLGLHSLGFNRVVAAAEARIESAPPVHLWAYSYPVYASSAYMDSDGAWGVQK